MKQGSSQKEVRTVLGKELRNTGLANLDNSSRKRTVKSSNYFDLHGL
jgi:hypothetical protein